jgi:hypothetical protein
MSERRDRWSLDSQGGSRAEESVSDGEKWGRVDDAAREAGEKLARIFGKGVKAEDR